MANDLLDKLAQHDVPPVPENLEHQLHGRLNRSLLATHLIDFTCEALPGAMFEFARALSALLVMTLTGQMPDPRRRADHDRPKRDRPPE